MRCATTAYATSTCRPARRRSGEFSTPTVRAWRPSNGDTAMYDFAYEKPATVADAVKSLTADPDAKALAGGQTFIPVLKQRLAKPTKIVDLAKTGLSGIKVSDSAVTIGATRS